MTIPILNIVIQYIEINKNSKENENIEKKDNENKYIIYND